MATKTTHRPDSAAPHGSGEASGSARRNPQFAPAMASSIMAATKCVQLAGRRRMPGASRISTVPAMPAAMPSQKAKPLDHSAARIQKGSAVHQKKKSLPAVAITSAIGKLTSIAWIGWPASATREPMS